MRLEELLDPKRHRVVTISKGQPLAKALELMVRKKKGALLVTADNKPWSLLTSKDLLDCIHAHPQYLFADVPVEDVVPEKIILAEKDESVRIVIEKMIKAGISHLPIATEKNIEGMIPLTDLMAFQIKTLMGELEGLEGYIADLQTAELD